ncbi:2-hydroxyacid dehydrogenase [Motilibacter peucedani]|uniref:2-hydroxyacid dehydrogenase n=1 Tax=Motilibacter peucedani TaxID=598650 RepID=UPI001E3ADA1E|nr:2-hydroxyacid dehydrogenase [Motilibacter peucedani]
MHALLSIDGVDLPDGVTADVWTGEGPLPDRLDEVEFFVAPYTGGSDATEQALEQLPNLKVVQLLSAGFETVRPLVPEGVLLCNGRGIHDASTSELALALVLAAQRDLPEFVRTQDEGRWEPRRTTGLADRTVLILGHGSIGAALERRLEGFEVEVLRVARTARDGVHGIDELPDLLPGVDIVVVLVPATPQTKGLVDAQLLSRMKDGALLVNVARGSIVDQDALLAELRSGRLRAALDVTDPEPLPEGHALWSAPGLLLTPHVGGGTAAMAPRARSLVEQQLRRWAAGEELANVITGDY